MNEFQIPWRQQRDEAVTQRFRLKGKTPNQEKYLDAMRRSVITICIGPAGTGKSYMACGFAAEQLRERRCERIVISRPMVTCGKGMGFLPGNKDEKVSPYMRPLLDAFEEFLSPNELVKLIEDGIIEMWPLELMRGASIKNSIIICDEAQNAEFAQLYMLLTRFGENTKLIVTGDATRKQNDLFVGDSPLDEVVKRFEYKCHKDVTISRLTRADIVRHPLIQWVDERLSAPIEELYPAEDDEPYELVCPLCEAQVYYDDPDDNVVQVKCCECDGFVDLWLNKTTYLPRQAKVVNVEKAVSSYECSQ